MSKEEKIVEAADLMRDKEEQVQWISGLEGNIQGIKARVQACVERDKTLIVETLKEASGESLYKHMEIDEIRGQLQQQRDESYERALQTLDKEKKKLLNSNNGTSHASEYQSKIRELQEEKSKLSAEKIRYEQELQGLKAEQKKLITESLELFVRHDNYLEDLLNQLREQQTVKKTDLKLCENLFEDAKKKAQKLAKEEAEKTPKFDRCNEYIMDAGKHYQACYASIIKLAREQQAIVKQESLASVEVEAGAIGASGAELHGEKINIGHTTNITQHIYNVSAQELEAIIKGLEDLKAKHDILQRDYSEKLKDFDLTSRELEKVEKLQRMQQRIDQLQETLRIERANLPRRQELTQLADLLKRGEEAKKVCENSTLIGSTELFLLLVAAGEQKEAKKMLKANPSLAKSKSTVTDLSGRTFEDITGFQYAVWALDWHMWTMILKYLPENHASLQLEVLERDGTAYGQYFSFKPLINKLDMYARSFEELYKSHNYKKLRELWCQVGAIQRWLPAHVINQYCQSRSFDPIPDFLNENLQRSMKTAGGFWFSPHDSGTLGVTYAIARGEHKVAYEIAGVAVTWGASEGGDYRACVALETTCLQQLGALKFKFLPRDELAWRDECFEAKYVLLRRELADKEIQLHYCEQKKSEAEEYIAEQTKQIATEKEQKKFADQQAYACLREIGELRQNLSVAERIKQAAEESQKAQSEQDQKNLQQQIGQLEETIKIEKTKRMQVEEAQKVQQQAAEQTEKLMAKAAEQIKKQTEAIAEEQKKTAEMERAKEAAIQAEKSLVTRQDEQIQKQAEAVAEEQKSTEGMEKAKKAAEQEVLAQAGVITKQTEEIEKLKTRQRRYLYGIGFFGGGVIAVVGVVKLSQWYSSSVKPPRAGM